MQHYKIHGGIESCAYSLIEGLNRRGIVPDVIGRLNDPSEEEGIHREVSERFGRRLEFEFHPLWVDRFRKGALWKRVTTDASLYVPLQMPFLRLNFTFDFTLPLPLHVPRGRYLKYWNFYRGADNQSVPRRPRLTAPLLDPVRERLFDRGYPIFLNSRFASENATSVLGRRLPVVYPPVAVRRLWSAQTKARRGIVTWGRFSPLKRQLDVVRVAADLHDTGFHEPFYLMGGTETFPDYYQSVVDAIKSSGLSNVMAMGNRPFSEVVQVLQSSALYVHTGVNEPFGITTAEAMAAGCVPLAHDSGGQREIVPFENLRWRQLTELSEKIRRLVQHPEERDTWQARCQEHVLKFDEERFQEALLAFLPAA